MKNILVTITLVLTCAGLYSQPSTITTEHGWIKESGRDASSMSVSAIKSTSGGAVMLYASDKHGISRVMSMLSTSDAMKLKVAIESAIDDVNAHSQIQKESKSTGYLDENSRIPN